MTTNENTLSLTLKHPTMLKDSHIHKILSSSNEGHKLIAANLPNLTDEHINKMLDDSSYEYFKRAGLHSMLQYIHDFQ